MSKIRSLWTVHKKLHAFIQPLEARRLMAAGELDPTFSGDGKASIDFHQRQDQAQGVAVQTDGRVVVAGWSAVNDTGGEDWAIVRYTAGGALDTSFNGTGRREIDFFGQQDRAQFAMIQPDQKIVVVGKSFDPARGTLLTVVRLNSNGSFDTSFDSDGIATLSLPKSFTANAAALDADSRVVVAGTSFSKGTGTDFAAVRLTIGGQLDTTFGAGGMSSIALSTNADVANAIAITGGGRIVLGGTRSRTNSVDSTTDFALTALNANGSIDATFGNAGTVVTPFFAGSESSAIRGLAIQRDGRIVAAGNALNLDGIGNEFALARYTYDGALDTTFSEDGKLTTAVGSGLDVAYALKIQLDGKIIAAGIAAGPTTNDTVDFALARYLDDGTLDSSFGESFNGIAITNFNGSINIANDDRILAMEIGDDGRIVVAGDAQTDPNLAGAYDFAVARYVGDSGTRFHLRGDAVIGANDNFRMVRNGSKVDFYINNSTNVPNFSESREEVGGVIIDGFGGDDTLTIIGQVPSPIFNGGSGHDVFNAGGVTNISYDPRVGSADLTLNAPASSSVQLFSTQHFGTLNIDGKVTLSGEGRLLGTRTLNMGDTGILELNNNAMIVDYSGASVLGAVQNRINLARNGGAWDRPGITSAFAASNFPAITTLAAMEASDYRAIYGANARFAGDAIDSSAVLIKYTYYGDTNFDNRVNFDDYSRTDAGFNNRRSGWSNGDFNGDGRINFDDYVLIDASFNALANRGASSSPVLAAPGPKR